MAIFIPGYVGNQNGGDKGKGKGNMKFPEEANIFALSVPTLVRQVESNVPLILSPEIEPHLNVRLGGWPF